MTDPYKVLGVSKTASAVAIKAAYRNLVNQLHPVLNPGDAKVEQRFKEVSHAYGIVGDAEKRKRFDRGEIDASGQETAWKGGFYRQQSGSGPQTKYSQAGPGDAFSAESIFSDLFGARMRPRSGKRKGEDVTYSISVSFLEAAIHARFNDDPSPQLIPQLV